MAVRADARARRPVPALPLGRAERIVGDDAALAGFEAQEPAEADRGEGLPRPSG